MKLNDHYKTTLTYHRIGAVEKDGYYEAVAGKPLRHTIWQLRIRKMILSILDKMLPVNPDISSIIDVGCGKGDFTIEIAKRYPQLIKLHGCDFVKEALYIAQRDSALLDNILFEEAHLLNLPFDKSTLDIALCINVLHHIYRDDLEKALSELARITRKYLILEIKNINNIWYKYIFLHSVYGMNMYPTSINEVSDILIKHNFRLIENHGIFLFNRVSPLIVLVYEKQN